MKKLKLNTIKLELKKDKIVNLSEERANAIKGGGPQTISCPTILCPPKSAACCDNI